MTDAERIAEEFRKIRKCEHGPVPCPFCRWDNEPDENEMGCLWLAERLLQTGVVKVLR